jgi:hypothetical protein
MKEPRAEARALSGLGSPSQGAGEAGLSRPVVPIGCADAGFPGPAKRLACKGSGTPAGSSGPPASFPGEALEIPSCPYSKLNSSVAVVKTTDHGLGNDPTEPLDSAPHWRVLLHDRHARLQLKDISTGRYGIATPCCGDGTSGAPEHWRTSKPASSYCVCAASGVSAGAGLTLTLMR